MHLHIHSITNVTFSLDTLLGLDAIISLICLFPFGLIGEHKRIPKCYMVTTWIHFSSGNLNIFLASHFCLSHRLPQILQMLLSVNRLRLNLLYWTKQGQWGLEHWNNPMHWTINLSPLNPLCLLLLRLLQVWPRSTTRWGFKALFRIKWNIKNGSHINTIW